GDIGRGGSIRGLFRQHHGLQPHLSLHAQTHPPAAIALLWIFSWAVGRDPLRLSLATAAFASLAIAPLFLWLRELAGRRTALLGCLLYAVLPACVIFAATSADILFMPVVLATLCLFERAIRRGSWPCALAAGVFYALAGLFSFNLLCLGFYFAVVGIQRLWEPRARRAVLLTAGVMTAGFLGAYAAVYAWSGFSMIACFNGALACHADAERAKQALGYPVSEWAWRLINPVCWFYYAGVPIALLFIASLVRFRRGVESFALTAAITLLILNLLFHARGEVERSALYVFPFIAAPAAARLDRLARDARSTAPVVATVAFLAFQCWLTEVLFDTYW
ncbi:MAG: glycosyltransferase family 39 protein, partial [Candidatus Hydrogenedentes bacterium]|nr:glycosyltransferase family 39 protein [Candidatus Hydrogenedentota bacterium]